MNIIPDISPERLQDAIDGDAEALNSIVAELTPPVYRFCLSMLADEALAEDAAQDALVRVCSSLPEFEGRSKFSTWVYRIASNRCLDLLRSKSSRVEDSLDALAEAHDGEETIAAQAQGEGDFSGPLADRMLVEEALSKLDAQSRSILMLREVSGLAYDEISEALGIPEGTVKSRLFRAREDMMVILRRMMSRAPGNTIPVVETK